MSQEEKDLINKEDKLIKSNKKSMPSMNIVAPDADENCLIEDDRILGVYDEVLDNIRNDRGEIDELLAKFIDMVMNEGDATTSTKEAVVNLLKIKTDTSDKMAKIADLMTRIKLKETNTFPKYLAAQQHNHINIRKSLSPAEKRALIENENKKKSEEETK